MRRINSILRRIRRYSFGLTSLIFFPFSLQQEIHIVLSGTEFLNLTVMVAVNCMHKLIRKQPKNFVNL